jgi:hypothetical protein
MGHLASKLSGDRLKLYWSWKPAKLNQVEMERDTKTKIKGVNMESGRFLSSEQVSRIFTLYSPNTVRLLAMAGEIPVASWFHHEPVFNRDPGTVRAIFRLTRAEKQRRTGATKRSKDS